MCKSRFDNRLPVVFAKDRGRKPFGKRSRNTEHPTRSAGVRLVFGFVRLVFGIFAKHWPTPPAFVVCHIVCHWLCQCRIHEDRKHWPSQWHTIFRTRLRNSPTSPAYYFRELRSRVEHFLATCVIPLGPQPSASPGTRRSPTCYPVTTWTT